MAVGTGMGTENKGTDKEEGLSREQQEKVTKAKKPMETLSAPSAIEGRKEAISRVALTISTTRTKNPRILFPEPANIDFFSNARPLVRHKSRKNTRLINQINMTMTNPTF